MPHFIVECTPENIREEARLLSRLPALTLHWRRVAPSVGKM